VTTQMTSFMRHMTHRELERHQYIRLSDLFCHDVCHNAQGTLKEKPTSSFRISHKLRKGG
jgi:hypothetical protein